jgi:signal transduction histidine kinase
MITRAMDFCRSPMGSAALRIGQIKHHARQILFGPIDLTTIARDAFERYAPLAEEREFRLHLQAGQPGP